MRSGSLLVAVCLTAAAPLTAQDPAERKSFIRKAVSVSGRG